MNKSDQLNLGKLYLESNNDQYIAQIVTESDTIIDDILSDIQDLDISARLQEVKNNLNEILNILAS